MITGEFPVCRSLMLKLQRKHTGRHMTELIKIDYKQMKSLATFLSGIFIFSTLSAQEIAIGQWREHLSYQSATLVTEGGGKVYCATKSGLFCYNKNDNSFDRLSKIIGLSDVGVSAINYNEYNKTLVIAYGSSNIDMVKSNTIVNIADIKRKSILGNKAVNSIHFIGNYAYLACGFGIVVLDTEKEEIKDTYYIGPNGGALNVLSITDDGNKLYAASNKGIYSAPLASANLSNYNEWTKHSGLPTGTYNAIVHYNGSLFTNFSKRLTDGSWMQDTIFINDGSGWQKFSGTGSANVRQLKVMNGRMIAVREYEVEVFSPAFVREKHIHNYGFSSLASLDVIYDASGVLWVADAQSGLVRTIENYTGEPLTPDGPASSNVYNIDVSKGDLWIVPGGLLKYNKEGVSTFIDNQWNVIKGQQGSLANLDTVLDPICVTIDPEDEKHVFVGVYGKGLMEFQDNQLVHFHKETNSTLQPLNFPGYYHLRVMDVVFDEDKNVWVNMSEVTKALSLRRINDDGDTTWQAFDFSGFIDSDTKVRTMIVTKGKQVWMALPEDGILVYEFGDDFEFPNSTNTKVLNAADGNGGLPTRSVRCLAEDDDGEVWVGTNEGVAVFYSPESIFSSSENDWDAQQILIEQDGHIQLLLETEAITDIAIDGANRKWIATQNSGAFLMSSDGTEQLLHFTAGNSPLLSNEITDIAINHENGEVFFGTANGIISYKSTATEGGDFYGDVYAYPNPVRPNYEGIIAIRGLVKNADVKITDISGNLIYSTQAEGGQATWNGKNFEGRRAQTGVYLVFSSGEDGSQTNVTKILFIN